MLTNLKNRLNKVEKKLSSYTIEEITDPFLLATIQHSKDLKRLFNYKDGDVFTDEILKFHREFLKKYAN